VQLLEKIKWHRCGNKVYPVQPASETSSEASEDAHNPEVLDDDGAALAEADIPPTQEPEHRASNATESTWPADPEIAPTLELERRASKASVSTWTSSAPEPPEMRVGQTVMTVQGLKGRVASVVGDEVRLAVPGFEQPVPVSAHDLTVLKVLFLGGRGFRSAKRTGKMLLYCSCLVQGEPSSEVRMPAEPAGNEASWQHEVDLLGCGPGDSVAIRLWGQDPKTHSERLLGEAPLPSALVSNGGFESALQLGLDGKCLPAYLRVMVINVNMPLAEDF